MISRFEQITDMLKEIDGHLKRDVELYAIGGAMMLYHGLKIVTKDIDVIVESKREFADLSDALKAAGFLPKIPSIKYSRLDLSQILVKDDFRIDLFEKKVCGGLALSDDMKRRSIRVLKLERISLHLCSPEDVLLFKTMTERAGDIDDCMALAVEGVDWSIILGEVQHQIRLSGNHVWITWIGERLDLLEEKKLVIPIMKDIDKLRELFFDSKQ